MKNPGFHISWEPIHVEVSAAGDMGYALEETKISMTDLTGKSVDMLFNRKWGQVHFSSARKLI